VHHVDVAGRSVPRGLPDPSPGRTAAHSLVSRAATRGARGSAASELAIRSGARYSRASNIHYSASSSLYR